MRVTLVGVNYAPETSGIAPYTAGLAEGLHRAGHDVSVLTSFPHYPEWRVRESSRPRSRVECIRGVKVTRLRHYVPADPGMVKRAAFELSFGRRLLTAAWGRPEVVICVSPALLSSAIAVMRARTTVRPRGLGLVVQDLYSRGVVEAGTGGLPIKGIAARVESGVLRRADGVVVIHDRFRKVVTTEFGVPEERVRVIRNWTHLDKFSSFNREKFREWLGWRPAQTVVLHAGAMGAKQGLENVVEAARLADSRGEAVRFVLLGDGSQRASLERAAAGIRSIEFRDPMSDDVFGKALRAADVLLVNERPEVLEMALPSKLTSYFKAGRPILAATDAHSTTAEELEASGAGVRVDSAQPEQLLRAVLSLRSRPDETARYAENGVRYCANILSEETAIAAYSLWVSDLAHHRGVGCFGGNSK